MLYHDKNIDSTYHARYFTLHNFLKTILHLKKMQSIKFTVKVHRSKIITEFFIKKWACVVVLLGGKDAHSLRFLSVRFYGGAVTDR